MVLRRQHFQLFQSIVSKYPYFCVSRRTIGFGVKFNSSAYNTSSPPRILDANTVESVKDYLTNIGANITKIEKEIKFSKLDLVEKVKLVAVLQERCDLEPMDVGRMVSKRPRILLLDEEHVKRCIDVLRNVGLKGTDIGLMFKKSPGILTSRIEQTLEEKIDVLYNLNVLPPFSKKDVLKIIKKCPALVSTCTPASIQEKNTFLQNELGFYRRQLSNMIIKQPSILTFSQESIKAKFDYCFQEMGMAVPDIARCPRVWQCSLKRLNERYSFLRHLELITNDTHIDDFGLGKIVTPSDNFFAEHVAKKSLVEFQEFARKISKE